MKTYGSDIARAGRIVKRICDRQSHNKLAYSEVKEAILSLSELDDDMLLDFDGNEYRIISESAIWEIYVEEIQQVVEDCYDLNLDKVPSFVALSIDWEQTAQNCYLDGYGHHFSRYDGSEENVAGYYIFRTT